MTKVVVLAATLMLAAACLMPMQQRLDTEAKAVARIVRAYCEQTDPNLRRAFRASANEQSYPHTFQVTCRQRPEEP
jgi:hypothetical protein